MNRTPLRQRAGRALGALVRRTRDDGSAAASPRSWWQRSWWQWLGMVVVLLGVLVQLAPAAGADPVDPATVPESLRQYVPDSAEWQTSPWMTAESCRDHGGDWSVYVTHLMKDFPELLEHFQPEFAGTDDNATKRKTVLLGAYQNMGETLTVPSGYCVDQVRRWAKSNPQFQPFGFEWGNVENWGDHGVRPRANCSTVKPDDLAPCRGFYLTCDGAATQQEDQLCEYWNGFSDTYVRRVNTAITNAYRQFQIKLHGTGLSEKTTPFGPLDIILKGLDVVVDTVMAPIVNFIVTGVVNLWGIFMRIAVDVTSPNLTGVAFTSVYNLVAGIALALGFLGWLVTLATSWKRGHLQFSLLGGIKATVGVTLAGVGAILMLQLADESTKSLISAGGDIAQQADFTTSLAKANPLVAILAGVLIAISLIFSIIFLVINGALVLMWALFGAIAAAGQVHEATSGWLLKWGSRLTALAWAKFFMVAVMLLAQLLLLPLDAGDDPVRQVVDVIQGLALCLLVVLCPWLLWELVDFVGDRIGGAAAVGGVAGRAASSGSTRAARATPGALGTASSAVGTAVGAMIVAAAHLGRHFPGGSTTGRGSGADGAGSSGTTPVPRPETDTVPDRGPSTEDTARPATPSPVPGPETSSAVPPPAGVSEGAGGTGAMPPKPPANRGQVVTSQWAPPPPAAASSTPTGSPTPAGGEAGAAGPTDTGTRSGSAPPRMPPPA